MGIFGLLSILYRKPNEYLIRPEIQFGQYNNFIVRNPSKKPIHRFRLIRRILEFDVDPETLKVTKTKDVLIYLTQPRITLEAGKSMELSSTNQDYATCTLGKQAHGIEFMSENSLWFRYLKWEDSTGADDFTKEELKLLKWQSFIQLTVKNIGFVCFFLIIFTGIALDIQGTINFISMIHLVINAFL